MEPTVAPGEDERERYCAGGSGGSGWGPSRWRTSWPAIGAWPGD